MSEPTQEEVISIVSSQFQVSNVDLTLESLKFKIEDSEFKTKFVELAQKLESKDLISKIEKTSNGTYILVHRLPPRKQRKWLSSAWIARILFGIVIGLVMIDGYYRTIFSGVDLGNPFEMAIIYTLSLIGILGVHELGHLVLARVHNLKTSWPYFIPGVPIIMIPTFGALITSRGLMTNRHILFDVAVAGPIAGLIITIIVTMYAVSTAPVTDEFPGLQFQEFQFLEPLLMKGIFELYGKGGENHVFLTPVVFAAFLGFLITFLNLVPAWQLDGGHMFLAIFGPKLHRIGTYASMGALVLIGFWPFAMLVLFLSARSLGVVPLDNYSPLPKNRMLLYIIIVGLAIICAPIASDAPILWLFQ